MGNSARLFPLPQVPQGGWTCPAQPRPHGGSACGGLTWALTFSMSCCSRWINLFISRISFLRLRRLSQWFPAVSWSSSYCRTGRSEPGHPPCGPSQPSFPLSPGSSLLTPFVGCSGFLHLLCFPSPFPILVFFWAAAYSLLTSQPWTFKLIKFSPKLQAPFLSVSWFCVSSFSLCPGISLAFAPSVLWTLEGVYALALGYLTDQELRTQNICPLRVDIFVCSPSKPLETKFNVTSYLGLTLFF